ncbi:MAG TPA: hypothetical protein VJR29_08965 [bacterium]|nr:hypothetical protein [bacterium]
MTTFRLALSLFAALTLFQNIVLAAPGELDPSFDFNGVAALSLSAAQDIPGGIAVQSDGKILVAGVAGFPAPEARFAVVRLRPDGSVDSGFGEGGTFLSSVTSSGPVGVMALQADGKIVIAGTSGSDGILLRLLPDGDLDPDFGSGGVADDGGVAGAGVVQAMALQADGKILVAGTFGGDTGGFTLFRFLPGGELDLDFGPGGFRQDSLDDFVEFPEDLEVLPDGRILSVGYTNNFVAQEILLAAVRYTPAGGLDGSLDGDGILLTNFGNAGGAVGTAALPLEDGRFLVAGGIGAAGSRRLFVARLNEDGSPDAGFDENGVVTVPFGFDEEFATELLAQSDGKILVFGVDQEGAALLLARLHPDGRVDESFGSFGKVVFSELPVNNSFTNQAAFQADGKFVYAAEVADDSGSDFTVFRFLGDDLGSTSCGDGNLDAGEECDDGNSDDGDGCSGGCQDETEGDISGGGCQLGHGMIPAGPASLFILALVLSLARLGACPDSASRKFG